NNNSTVVHYDVNNYNNNYNQQIFQPNYSLIPKSNNNNHNHNNNNNHKPLKISEDKLDALSSELGLSPEVVSNALKKVFYNQLQNVPSAPLRLQPHPNILRLIRNFVAVPGPR